MTTGFHVTKVKQHIESTAETAHITLKVCSGKIEMKADGTINIEGVHVTVNGSSRIDLNS